MTTTRAVKRLKRVDHSKRTHSRQAARHSRNSQRAEDAVQRIKTAIAQLKAAAQFPPGANARANAITRLAKCSNQTLHKHKDLWHPDYVKEQAVAQSSTLQSQASLLPVQQQQE